MVVTSWCLLWSCASFVRPAEFVETPKHPRRESPVYPILAQVRAEGAANVVANIVGVGNGAVASFNGVGVAPS